MKLLVTGANGQLGNEIRILAAASPIADSFIFSDLHEVERLETKTLDITDAAAVRQMVQDNSIGCIINCAAFTDVEKAEQEEELAEKINAEAPKILAEVMREFGGLLVQISTDYVFGKEAYNIPCSEGQRGTPTGAYGRTKLHAESHIIASGADYVIIRTAWLYSEFGKNFLKTMLKAITTKPSIQVVFDQVGTPTYALDLAVAIMTVLEDYLAEKPVAGQYSKNGIYHFSNEGVCSWYDFAKMIAEFSGNNSCSILPCHSSEFKSSVVRPAYSVLDKTKIKKTFGLTIPYWTDSLKKCLHAYE